MEDFSIRRFSAAKDLPATKRIWRECGWFAHPSDEAYVDDFYSVGRGFSATLDEVAECVGQYIPATMAYQDTSINMAAITAIITSPIARRRGLAKAVTAKVVADAAQHSAELATLGMFEQGFYDQLGFGSGSYEHLFGFDPANLKSCGTHRIPRRLDKTDYQVIHDAMKNRWCGHGGCVLNDVENTKACIAWLDGGWGLGYENDEGELTHFFFGKLSEEHGPLSIHRFAYQNADQLRELLSLLGSVADQVSQIKLIEPVHTQLQDFLKQPFRFWRLSKGSAQENFLRAEAVWQSRILDLPACLAKTELLGPRLEFNLTLSDPIEQYLDTNERWRGIGGAYEVHLGENSSAQQGTNPELPTLTASVNAFTRMWLGVRPATELAISDELHGDQELLESLDETLRLPPPKLGWYF